MPLQIPDTVLYHDFLNGVLVVHLATLHRLQRSLQQVETVLRGTEVHEAGANVRMLERKVSQAEEKNATLYENYVCGIVEKEDFDMMKERYIQNLQELRDELQAAKQKQRMLEKKADRYMDMVNNLEPYLYERSFNEKLVQELVEYVEVYKNGNIHVCFRCDDKFQQIIELIEGVKSAEERIIS